MAHITMHAANAAAITKAANATKMRAKTIARNLRSYRALKKKWGVFKRIARSVMSLFVRKKSEPQISERTRRILEEENRGWRRSR
jgi:hypothetical protein